ncbi:MAG: hypothetical protein K9G67_03380 [Bacteroidales bacterium]|nr:hypothetical protein [Bacteroidales bacterium]MCF8344820.1 hypothetical protein [Bacteroidales bacterium]MCF8351410.1 hypothetical protein [Bacteroidales bacterium]MCF8375372.1 hypothetical protein [Bacteroidales bacterium]
MNKKNKKILIILLSVIVVLIIAYVIVNRIASNKIRDKINEVIEKTQLSDYVISIGRVNVNLLSREVILKDVKFITDTTTQTDRLDVYAGRIRIDGVHYSDLIVNNKLLIEHFVLIDPEIRLNGKVEFKSQEQDTTRAGRLKSIRISKLSCEEGRLVLEKKNMELLKLQGIDFTFEDVFANLHEAFDVDSLYKDYEIDIREFSHKTGNGMYLISGGTMKLNHKDSTISAKDIRIEPQYEKYSFSERLGYQTDRFDISIPDVNIRKFNIKKMIKEGRVEVEKISTGKLRADIFRNKQIARPEGHRPLLPQQALRKIPFKLLLDTLQMDQLYLKYSEHVPYAEEAGYVEFDPMNMLFVNINNDPGFFGVANRVSLFATGTLMGSALAKVRVYIPIYHPADTFFFSGSLDPPFEMAKLNTILTPNQNARINSGTIDKLVFEGSANNVHSSGEATFLYHDLNITVMEKENEKQGDEKKFYSFVMNRLLRSNNPVGNKKPLIAEMYFERDMEKSAINFLWKSLYSGVKATITPGKKNLRREK